MEPQPNPTEIRVLIQRHEWSNLRAAMAVFASPDVADLLMRLHKFERVLLFRALARDRAAEVFAHLMREEQDALLAELTDSETRELLASLAPDDRAALLGELPAEVMRRLLNLLGPQQLEEARLLLGFPPESTGRYMTPEYVAVDPESTVEDVLAYVRHFGRDSVALDRIFVVDGSGELTGEIPLRQLILAEPGQLAHEIADRAVVSIPAFEDREAAVRLMERYVLAALPVTGSDGHLIGIVTFDDLLPVAAAETSEDIYLHAGLQVSGDEAARSRLLLTAPLLKALRLRIPWLMIALVGGLAAAFVMSGYQETLEAVVALAFFVPLIMDMGGNVGTQASTIFVRGMAVGQIKADNLRQHLPQELALGAVIGLIIGGLAAAAAYLWQGIAALAAVIFLSMLTVCTFASLIGYGIPWLVHRLGFDPATVSDPFITAIKDVTALLIYFALAAALLGAIGG
jgi:magnesium transporter